MDRSGGHLIAAFLPIKITQTSDWKVWANDQMLPHRSKQFTIYQWCVWKFKLNKKQFTNAKYYKILQSVFHPCGRYKNEPTQETDWICFYDCLSLIDTISRYGFT